MAAVSDALEALDTDARSRVLQWAAAKYSVKIGLSQNAKQDGASDQPPPGDKENAGTRETNFDTFADLYAAARPSRDPEKLLVAAYWHQIVKGEKELASGALNKDLTNLGINRGRTSKYKLASLAGVTN